MIRNLRRFGALALAGTGLVGGLAACGPRPVDASYTLFVTNESAEAIRIHPSGGADPAVDYLVESGTGPVRIEALQLPVATDRNGETVIGLGTILVWSGECRPIDLLEVSVGPNTVVVASDGAATAGPLDAPEPADAPDALPVSPPCA